jgi:hypothetical protein
MTKAFWSVAIRRLEYLDFAISRKKSVVVNWGRLERLPSPFPKWTSEDEIRLVEK